MKEELLKGLTDEQIAKLRECKNHDELLNLAKQEGVELTDEQLEVISGGGVCSSDKCPNCGSKNYTYFSTGNGRFCKCQDCRCSFNL